MRLVVAILALALIGTNVTFWLLRDPPLSSVIKNKETAIVAITSEKLVNGKSEQALGTGFFIDENTIVTNNHVIEDSTKLEIMHNGNRTKYAAQVKWTDKSADIAIIQITDWKKFKEENPDFTYLKFNTEYSQGDNVIVLGNPSGLMFSASLGIVSQERQKLSTNPQFYVGSDAHLYPGNSGGPMLNKWGEVLAVSDLMLPTDGGSYGFGIPAAIVMKVIEDFKKYNEVRWATLGVTLDGNKVTDIATGSASEKAGLKVGDTINFIIIDNFKKKVNDASDITNELAQQDYQVPVRLIVNDKEAVLSPTYRTSKDFVTTGK